MKLETGEPMMDGRYVVYVEGLLGWLEPHIVVRVGKKWKFLGSTQDYPDAVHCWSGPLPVMSKSAFQAWDGKSLPSSEAPQWGDHTSPMTMGREFFEEPPQEFDL